MATSPAISSSFLSAINHHSSRQNPSLLHNHKRLTFKIRAAKLPAGVVLPKEQPKFQAPFLGFTRTAEIWNSRACMIGLIGTFIVELIVSKGILEVIDGAGMHQLIVVNNCKESIWPGIQGGAGHNTPRDGGLLLTSGQEVVIDVPEKWSGRIWGRQGCNFDANGKGSCATGDCTGQLHCRGQGGEPPATVVEMTLGSPSSALHFYDVSLVDGFNLPVSMKPVGGGIGCGVASCEVDVNVCCPAALEVRVGGRVVGCKSACLAMQSAKYCCTGEYSNPKTCRPTLFAHLFKAICPRAYTYAFDDSSTLNKCRASRYVITFCPPT